MAVNATGGYGNTSGGGRISRLWNHIHNAVRMFGDWHQRNLDRKYKYQVETGKNARAQERDTLERDKMKANEANAQRLHIERMARTGVEQTKAEALKTKAQGELYGGEAKKKMADNDTIRAKNEGQKNQFDYNLGKKQLENQAKAEGNREQDTARAENNRHNEAVYNNETNRIQVNGNVKHVGQEDELNKKKEEDRHEEQTSKNNLDLKKENYRHEEVENGDPHEWTSGDALKIQQMYHADNEKKEQPEVPPTKEIPKPTPEPIKEEKKPEIPTPEKEKSSPHEYASEEDYKQIDKDHPQNEKKKVSLDGSKETPKKEIKAQANLDAQTPGNETKIVKAKKPHAVANLDLPTEDPHKDEPDYYEAVRQGHIKQAKKDLQERAGANGDSSQQAQQEEASWLKSVPDDKKKLYELLSKYTPIAYKAHPEKVPYVNSVIRSKIDKGEPLKNFFGRKGGDHEGVYSGWLGFLINNYDHYKDIAKEYNLPINEIIANALATKKPRAKKNAQPTPEKVPQKETKVPEQSPSDPFADKLGLPPEKLQAIQQFIKDAKAKKQDVDYGKLAKGIAKGLKSKIPVDDITKWLEGIK